MGPRTALIGGRDQGLKRLITTRNEEKLKKVQDLLEKMFDLPVKMCPQPLLCAHPCQSQI